MSESAEVASIAALRDFHVSLTIFQEEVHKAVAAADMEIRRGQNWIDDRLRSWERAQRDFSEEVSRAKLALQSRKLFKLWDRPPDCTEQEEALDLAERRLEHAEERIASCKKWRMQYLKAVEEFEVPLRRLQNLADADLGRGKALLARMSEVLESYTDLAPTALPDPPATAPREEAG
jgi:chromosome segregation ATPase